MERKHKETVIFWLFKNPQTVVRSHWMYVCTVVGRGARLSGRFLLTFFSRNGGKISSSSSSSAERGQGSSSSSALVNWHLEWFPLLSALQGGAPLGSLPQLQQRPRSPPTTPALSMCSFPRIGIIGQQGTKPMTEHFRDLWGALILIIAIQWGVVRC